MLVVMRCGWVVMDSWLGCDKVDECAGDDVYICCSFGVLLVENCDFMLIKF